MDILKNLQNALKSKPDEKTEMFPEQSRPIPAYRKGQLKREEGCIVSTEIEGELIRFFITNPTDEIQKYLYAGNFYEYEELQIIKKYYRKGSVFVDIGTNIGNHAIYAEKILKAPEVIVFEPNPVALEYLEINLLLNGCRNINRDYLGAPISDGMGQRMTITRSPSNNLGNTYFGASPDGQYRSITGDFALAHRPVGFIKIDTEEMEFMALDGLRQTLAIWRPNVFIEVLESQEERLKDWVAKEGYQIAESQKRYEMLRNYILTPL